MFMWVYSSVSVVIFCFSIERNIKIWTRSSLCLCSKLSAQASCLVTHWWFQMMLRAFEVSGFDPGPLFSVLTFCEAQVSGTWVVWDISFLSLLSWVTALVVGALAFLTIPSLLLRGQRLLSPNSSTGSPVSLPTVEQTNSQLALCLVCLQCKILEDADRKSVV